VHPTPDPNHDVGRLLARTPIEAGRDNPVQQCRAERVTSVKDVGGGAGEGIPLRCVPQWRLDADPAGRGWKLAVPDAQLDPPGLGIEIMNGANTSYAVPLTLVSCGGKS
jgi:hypothetical protein